MSVAEVTVYQYDYDGYYTGTSLADESPLEPGVHLVPARCTAEPPPFNLESTQIARWVDGEWVVETLPEPTGNRLRYAAAKLKAFLAFNPEVVDYLVSSTDDDLTLLFNKPGV